MRLAWDNPVLRRRMIRVLAQRFASSPNPLARKDLATVLDLAAWAARKVCDEGK